MISKRAIVITIVMSATALFFQNCGKVGFNSLNSNPTLATESTTTPTTPTTPTVSPPTVTNSNTNTPTNPPTTTSTNTDDNDTVGANPNKPTCSGNNNDDNDNMGDEADLVECDLGANAKVILNATATVQSLNEDPSNAQSTRVCMSKHACLDLVNAYAQTHNCSLAIGAPTTPTNTSTCAEVFPGSAGTCHNAQILSDNAVESILASMKTD